MIQNIGNIKILKTSLVFFLLSIGVALALDFGGIEVLNYGVAFLSFVCVFLSLFFAFNKLGVMEIEKNDAVEEKVPFSHKVSLGMRISFSIFRFFSYAFLLIALIALLEYQIFEIYAYFAGIFVALCCVILQFLWR